LAHVRRIYSIELVALVAWGCSAPPRDHVDASADAEVNLCGNGVIDWDGDGDSNMAELCDEGALNGTPEGRCTKQCNPAEGTPIPSTRLFDVGRPIDRTTPIISYWGDSAIASTSVGDHGIVVWKSNPDPGPNPIELRVQAPAVAVGEIIMWRGGPAWIEMNPGESPHLYYAELLDSGGAEVHELPYPFPDGTRPEIMRRSYNADVGVLIVDHNATGELLVAMVIARSATEVVTFSKRFAAPAGVRGIAVDTGSYRDRVEQRDGSRQIIVFFDDPGSFVSIDVRFTGDLYATWGTVEITEAARGPWPYRVIAGDTFWKQCSAEYGHIDSFTHPVPLFVLTDAGDILVWQFDHGLSGESFVPPFARVTPGTRAISGRYGSSAFVLEPDGTALRFTDGDCRDLRSTAIMPTRVPYTAASTNASLALNSDGYVATAGSVLYLD